MKDFAKVFGIIVLLAGLGFGFIYGPSVSEGGVIARCGAVFSGPDQGDAANKDQDNQIKAIIDPSAKLPSFRDACANQKQPYRIMAGAAIVVGLAMFVAGLAIPQHPVKES